jgi:hypothetical protein
MSKDASACQRSACGVPLDRGRYRIWNNPGSFPDYRDYCVVCGRSIIEYDRSTSGPKLKFVRIGREEKEL